jgi:CHAD domain-containing protein
MSTSAGALARAVDSLAESNTKMGSVKREMEMAHRIGNHEEIGLALIRLAVDDLAAARADLTNDGPSGSGVHQARQRLKQVRSMLRVLRPALGAHADHLTDQLRKAAGLLAETREADAAAASARSLLSAANADGAGLERVVATLEREVESRYSEIASFAEVESLLAAVGDEISTIDDDIDGDDLLLRAIDRAYRRGRMAMRRATFSLATPDLHEWRKAVKDLWHLIRLARKRLPSAIAERAPGLKRLGETLGLDHDHAMLAERLALSPEGDPALMQQLSLIANQRLVLEAEAFALGAKLYRQKPKKLRRQLRVS